MKSMRIELAGLYITHGREQTYKVLIGNFEKKIPLGIYRHRCKNNIKIDLNEIGWEGVYWIHLAQE
jgi:hypothetical protein